MDPKNLKKEISELESTLAQSNSVCSKLAVISKLTAILAILQHPDTEVPPDVFEGFDADGRKLILQSFLLLTLQSLQ